MCKKAGFFWDDECANSEQATLYTCTPLKQYNNKILQYSKGLHDRINCSNTMRVNYNELTNKTPFFSKQIPCVDCANACFHGKCPY